MTGERRSSAPGDAFGILDVVTFRHPETGELTELRVWEGTHLLSGRWQLVLGPVDERSAADPEPVPVEPHRVHLEQWRDTGGAHAMWPVFDSFTLLLWPDGRVTWDTADWQPEQPQDPP